MAVILEGVCEVGAGVNFYGMGELRYHEAVNQQGPWFLNQTTYMQNAVVSVTVPPIGSGNIPPCVLSGTPINDPAFMPNSIPPPFVGTDARGHPLFVALATSTTNTSQTNVTAWSAVTGQRVYGPSTYACGFPSYVYSGCPPTTGANWPLTGLFGSYLVNGTLLIGGGDWSNQQYFMGVLPAQGRQPPAGDNGAGYEGGAADGIPVFTFVNSTGNQGTWLSNNFGAAFVPAPGKWPLSVQYLPYSGGTCAAPTAFSSFMVNTIDKSGWVVQTAYNGATVNPACPLRQSDIPGWFATAACAGASVGTPDLFTAGF